MEDKIYLEIFGFYKSELKIILCNEKNIIGQFH